MSLKEIIDGKGCAPNGPVDVLNNTENTPVNLQNHFASTASTMGAYDNQPNPDTSSTPNGRNMPRT